MITPFKIAATGYLITCLFWCLYACSANGSLYERACKRMILLGGLVFFVGLLMAVWS